MRSCNQKFSISRRFQTRTWQNRWPLWFVSAAWFEGNPSFVLSLRFAAVLRWSTPWTVISSMISQAFTLPHGGQSPIRCKQSPMHDFLEHVHVSTSLLHLVAVPISERNRLDNTIWQRIRRQHKSGSECQQRSRHPMPHPAFPSAHPLPVDDSLAAFRSAPTPRNIEAPSS